MTIHSVNLSPAKRWLVHRMHQTNHGTMHNLHIQAGEPVLDPPPKVKQAFKLGNRRPARKPVPDEFLLKDQHLELFELLDAKQNGTIAKLVIQDGLPILAEWEDD